MTRRKRWKKRNARRPPRSKRKKRRRIGNAKWLSNRKSVRSRIRSLRPSNNSKSLSSNR